jgi:hypothetical protein
MSLVSLRRLAYVTKTLVAFNKEFVRYQACLRAEGKYLEHLQNED